MERENDLLFLMALTVVGAILATTLAVIIQRTVVLPLLIAIILILIFTALLNRKKAIHMSEKLETLAMAVALIAFIVSFIYLFRPA
jgi:energy-converting hydrogenase A subunit K